MEITVELAEIAGIHAGDGYLRYLGKRKELDISGGYEEKEYYDNYVIPLFNNVFGLSIKGRIFPSRRTYGFVTYNQKTVKKLAELGFPSGKKTLSVRIPSIILFSNDKKIIGAFLRGLFDTDGCLTFSNRSGNQKYNKFKKKYHYYPRILLRSVSKPLVDNIKILLSKLGFTYYVSEKKHIKKNWNDSYEICLAGQTNLLNWMNLIRMSNPTKLSRYLIWKKFGFCPTNITYQQRINILEGRLDPYKKYDEPVRI